MPPSDDGLLDRAMGGDADALAELLERHGPQVRRLLAGRVPARWQAVLSADDLMQETYQDAFLNLRSFEPRSAGSFVGWLMMLARRNLLDAIRMLTAEKRGGGRNRFDPQAGGPPAALCSQLVRSSSTPSRQAARREAGTCLRRAIARLPAAYRTVVEMYDLEGCPVERVADALGRSPGAVFMLRARAHRCLARIMGSASRYLTGRT